VGDYCRVRCGRSLKAHRQNHGLHRNGQMQTAPIVSRSLKTNLKDLRLFAWKQ
jgi:hypothetical protein